MSRLKRASLALAFAGASFSFLLPAVVQASSLTTAQISSIVSLLQSFGADSSTIANVQSALGGGLPISPACVTLKHSLTLGSTDTTSDGDVSRLQAYLQSLGYFNYSGAKGYYGILTADAVSQYQVAKGIAASINDNDAGIVGTKTLQALLCGGLPPAPLPDSPHQLTVSLVDPTGQGKESFPPGSSIILHWSDPTATAATRYYITLWPSTYPQGAGWPLAGSGYGLPDATGSTFTWQVDSRPTPGRYLFRVCRLGEDVCGASATIGVASSAGSAAVDSGSFSQSSSSFSVTGTASGAAIQDGVIVFLLPASYAYAADYMTVRGQFGKDGFYQNNGGGMKDSGAWSAQFQSVNPGSYRVAVYDANTKATLVTPDRPLTVTGTVASCTIHASKTSVQSGEQFTLNWTTQGIANPVMWQEVKAGGYVSVGASGTLSWTAESNTSTSAYSDIFKIGTGSDSTFAPICSVAVTIPPANATLLVAGVYGATDGSDDFCYSKPGTITVNVPSQNGHSVVLALTAYNPVNWVVRPAAGVSIQRVILAGYSPQSVSGVASSVPVERHTFLDYSRYTAGDDGQGAFFDRTNPTAVYDWSGNASCASTSAIVAKANREQFMGSNDYFYAYASSGSDYTKTANALTLLTGLSISQFKGAASASSISF